MSGDPQLLVVDDDPSMRRLLSVLLRSEGYTVDQASDGEEALKKAFTHGHDLILLDLNMPGMSGEQVFLTLRSEGFRAPIALVSASPALKNIADRLNCYYIAKPFVPELLLRTVARLVEESL